MGTNTSGTSNTTIGGASNVTAANLTNATAIGARATVAQSNALVLGSINGINGAIATVHVGIGTNAPNTSSSLDITGTSTGLLIPRMSKVQRNAIAAPATGLMVYQNAPDSMGFYYYNGTIWLWMATATNITGWLTTGNAGTDTAVNFIGTTTNMPLRFKQNNGWVGQLNSNTGNYFIGRNAGISNTSGVSNSAFGGFALASNTSGTLNTVMGVNALFANTTGGQNTAIGALAMNNHKTGGSNVAVGYQAIFADTTGSSNTAIGYLAMFGGGALLNNTAVGYRSLQHTGENSTNTLEGNYNTALGNNSGKEIKRGYRNVAIGNEALSTDTSGTGNTVIGANAAEDFLGGSGNVTIGHFAMSNARGSNKVAIGQSALRFDTSANGNTAIGTIALQFNQRGVSNVAIGMSAMRHNISASRNTAIGDSALMLQSFSVGNGIEHFLNNTAVGYKALFTNQPTNTSNGDNNTAVGSAALTLNTIGFDNTAIGSSALNQNTNGNENVAVGVLSLFANTTGEQNTAIGLAALNSNVSGSNNTAVGSNALTAAGLNNISYNSAVGFTATVLNNTVSNSTAIGAFTRVDTSNSVVLGSINGINGATASSNTGIGTTRPRARLHVVKDGEVPGGLVQNFSAAVIENNAATNYLQLLSPVNGDAGLISGTSATTIRSAVIFDADSSLRLFSGGGINRMTVNNTGFVGVRTAVPLSYLDVSGSTANAISTATVSSALDQFDHTHIILPTVAAVTLTLPVAGDCPRREYVIVNQDNSVHNFSITYLDFTAAAVTTIPANSSITLQSNGASWYRIR